MSNYVITGANSEIGRALADKLLSHGHNVLLISRSSKSICGSAEWIDGIDLTIESDLVRLRKKVSEHFNSPFALVHSVGDFWAHKSISNTPFSEAISQIHSHYLTLFGTIKAIIPIMQKNGGGKIIAFSCNSVRYNYPDMAAFTSSKAAVECLIKCIANEQSKYNVISNAFALPSIQTEGVRKSKPKEFYKNFPDLNELTDCIEQTIENLSPLQNGNIINLFKYSDSFYNKGYYQRNIIWKDNSNAGTEGLL